MKKLLSSATKWMNLEGIMLSKISQREKDTWYHLHEESWKKEVKCTKECGSEVFQSCPTLFDPMGCSLPGSSIHGIFQAKILEWVDISFSRGIFLTQDPLGLLQCRQTLYLLSHQGSPSNIQKVEKYLRGIGKSEKYGEAGKRAHSWVGW